MARSDRGGAAMTVPGGVAGRPAEVADLGHRVASRRDAGRVLRVLTLVTVAIGLAALTAAACVLSYGSIHALASHAGVSAPLARIYPLIFDALLVLAGSSVLALRGAGLVSRLYGWLCFLVMLGGLAAGGVVRAMAITVPRRPSEIAAAIIPFALVLAGFGLLLALLRHGRLRGLSERARQAELAERADLAEQAELAGQFGQSELAGQSEQAGAAGAPGPRPGRVAIPGMPAARRAPAVVGVQDATSPGVTAAGISATTPAEIPDPVGIPDPVKVEPVKVEPVKLAVRAADMQLRARVPRQPPAGNHTPTGDHTPTADQPPAREQRAAAGQVASPAPEDVGSAEGTARPAPPGHQEPFMPPVGRPADGPAVKNRKSSPRSVKAAGPAAVKNTPDDAATKPGPDANQVTTAPESGTPAAGSQQEALTSQAPQTQPLAFERPHSSPTPPEA